MKTGGGPTVLAHTEEKHWKLEEWSQLITAYGGALISSYEGWGMVTEGRRQMEAGLSFQEHNST